MFLLQKFWVRETELTELLLNEALYFCFYLKWTSNGTEITYEGSKNQWMRKPGDISLLMDDQHVCQNSGRPSWLSSGVSGINLQKAFASFCLTPAQTQPVCTPNGRLQREPNREMATVSGEWEKPSTR